MLLTTHSINLYAERTGNGPALLLLHGFSGSSAEWAELVPSLAKHHSVITVDLIGHGRSDAPADAQRYSMQHCIADLLELLDQLEIEQADVLGYSMGGRVALQLAAAAPERVRRLVLESASPGLAAAEERAARMASDSALAEKIEDLGIEWFANYWANIPLFASQAALPAEVRAALQQRRLANRPAGLAGSLRGMGTGAQPSLWAELGNLDMPVALICGELDQKFMQIQAKMLELLPNAQPITIAEAGHCIHLERPQAFLQAVVGFLEA